MSFNHILLISAYFGTFCIVMGDRYIGDMCSACLAVAYQFDQAFVKVKIFTFYFASRTIHQYVGMHHWHLLTNRLRFFNFAHRLIGIA